MLGLGHVNSDQDLVILRVRKNCFVIMHITMALLVVRIRCLGRRGKRPAFACGLYRTRLGGIGRWILDLGFPFSLLA